MSEYRPTIGVEVHAQLKTETKLFCGCPVAFGEEANTNVCAICLGLPGVLPSLNKKAVELAIKAGLALNCEIHTKSIFARKNYFYPDLPKGYQITQYRFPIATDGKILVEGKEIRIKRVHLEEESAKSIHETDKSLIDYNRSGVPLIEIVTEPDIDSPDMAVAYLKTLQKILQFESISDAVMARAEFRCEPNISVSKEEGKLGTRTEVKNLNSFKAVKNSLSSEIKRQIGILEAGEVVEQATIHYSEETGKTWVARSKEKSSDYRYFPEPDLPPLNVDKKWIEEIKATLGELPGRKKEKYISLGLSKEDAKIISSSSAASSLFEEILKLVNEPLEVSKWILRDYRSLGGPDISAASFAEMIEMVLSGEISRNAGAEVLAEMTRTKKAPKQIVKEKNLAQISDSNALEKIVREVLDENPDESTRLKKGEKKLIGFFVGQVMKKTKGKADPKEVSRIISEYEKKY
ncbi:Asp-tRNA(Asn)/Glu-tRNA(Gln) amidotransferase subunit GatB [candidate division WOR-3 bacterium]|nr:Asp-tRNA(Asn)/Glu-tRNA(Gln) amidotransferase subunit GatB [candidate division WOR-3 bacterium]